MPQRGPGEDFESELLKSVSAGDELLREPTFAVFDWVVALLADLSDPNPRTRERARALLKDLHYAFQWVRTHDDNGRYLEERKPGERAKKAKRVTSFKDALIPDQLARVRPLTRSVWPLLPFLSYVWDRLITGTVDPDVLAARLHECFFVMLCTQPRRMRVPIYTLAVDVVRSLQYDNVDPNDIAKSVMEGFARRPLPVARYKATARTVAEAAALVRTYMAGAIRRRAKGLLHSHVHPALLPPSTERRARSVHGVDTTNANAVAAHRKQMRLNQTRVPDDLYTIPAVARAFVRSRDTVTKALAVAERTYRFVAKRDRDGVTLMTPDEVKFVKACLPARRRRRRP